MAVAVDISGSKHLSYSPLHEKHNILYRGTRQSFNQRYKQKPWFRLNPFTDKGVGREANIDRYDPEFDVGISLLQSLVIVEDYFNDKPQFTQEFNISEFWDFLFSDSWSNGYSVRVFEGQLLEMMCTCLLSLTHAGKIVQHVTKAYAKTERQKYSIVKKASKKEPELITFIETLLLKFIYYGHVVKPECFDTVSSFGYPDVTTTSTATNSSCVRISTDAHRHDTTSSTVGPSLSDSMSPSPPPTERPRQTQHPRKRRIRAPNEILNQIERERSLITRFISRNGSIMPSPPPIPRDKSYRYTCSNFSNASDDYKSLPPRVDLNNFICTEKVSYLGEFNLPDDSSSSSSSEEEDEDDFGQNYYLGDTDQQIRDEVHDSTTEAKLRMRKETIRKMREKRKEEIAQLRKPIPKIMTEFSELDVQKYVKEHDIINVTGVPENEEVPTLEEYAAILESDQKREAKLKVKRMTSKIVKKNDNLTGKLGVKTSQAGFKMASSWKFSSPAQRMLFLEKKLKLQKKTIDVKRTNIIVVPLVYISLPSGRSFLHPISRNLMKIKKEEAAEEINKSAQKDTKRRTSLLPTVGTALSNELHRLRRVSQGTLSPSEVNESGFVKPKFPKIKLIPSDATIESPDEDDSDDEIDDLDQSIFDSKKLNIQYSRDRIRKATAAKRAEERKKKDHIYGVLKKYCRMQSVLKAFGGQSKRKRRSSLAGTSLKNRKKKASSEISALSEVDVVQPYQFADVGKLKKFAFLEAKEKSNTQSSQPMKALFQNYPMELFCENLERALKEFVVRRELVVSDYKGKTLVSITFTRKSVFTLSKYSADHLFLEL